MIACVRCEAEKVAGDFYASDRTCKQCRRGMAKANRQATQEQRRVYEQKRSATPHRRAHLTRNTQRYRAANPQRAAAHIALNNAVRDGRVKKQACVVCGSAQAHGHHFDYSRPLDVVWLCTEHHAAHHKIEREINRITTAS